MYTYIYILIFIYIYIYIPAGGYPANLGGSAEVLRANSLASNGSW